MGIPYVKYLNMYYLEASNSGKRFVAELTEAGSMSCLFGVLRVKVIR